MIHLPTPCYENWDEMAPAEGGRHCGSCNKILPDFTNKTEEEILEFMASSSTVVCGQFRTDQVTDGQTYGGWQHYFKWKAAVAVLLVGSLFFTSCRSKKVTHTRGRAYHYGPGISKGNKTKQVKWLIEPTQTDTK